jgi:phospholipid transport system substrate-binding protein
MRKILLAAVTLLLTLLAAGPALAGEATDLVKTKQEKLFALIAQPKSEARQKQLRALFDEILAYEVMAKASLGAEFDKLSKAEQTRFVELLTDVIRGNYRRNLTKMLDYKIEYTGEEKSDGATVVKTRAKHKTDKREPPIEIDFKMVKVKGKVQSGDIITERASMVKTYKSQFLKILRKDGIDKLFAKLIQKRDELAKD